MLLSATPTRGHFLIDALLTSVGLGLHLPPEVGGDGRGAGLRRGHVPGAARDDDPRGARGRAASSSRSSAVDESAHLRPASPTRFVVREGDDKGDWAEFFDGGRVMRYGDAVRARPGVKAAVAAGHPATAEAGIEILADGGTAADAAVAAALASCVAETVMTGLLGGGHAIVWDGTARAEPGLLRGGAERRGPGDGRSRRAVRRGDRALRRRAGVVRGARGCPAGLDALWREHGRLPWARLVEPALRLARERDRPAAAARGLSGHARAGDDAEPRRRALRAGRAAAGGGELLRAAGARRGARDRRRGGRRERVPGHDRRGAARACRASWSRATTSAAYEARWSEPVEVPYAGTRFLTRGGLSGVPGLLARLPRLGRAVGDGARAGARGRVRRPAAPEGHTTNLCVVDADGPAVVLTSSLGLGSGDFLPGLDLHLNSMLGEKDLLVGALEPGARMQSMMAPSVAVDEDGLALAIGSAGGTRLRTALCTVAAGVLDEGLAPQEAVDRPRFHPPAARSTPSRASTRRRCSDSSRPAARSGAGPTSTTTSAARASSPAGARQPTPAATASRSSSSLSPAAMSGVRPQDMARNDMSPAQRRDMSARSVAPPGSWPCGSDPGHGRRDRSGRSDGRRVASTSRAIWSISACSLSKARSSRRRCQSSTTSRWP